MTRNFPAHLSESDWFIVVRSFDPKSGKSGFKLFIEKFRVKIYFNKI